MATANALHEGDDVVAGSDAVAEIEHFDGSLTRLDTGATAALQRIADADGQPHLVLHLGPGARWHRTPPTRTRGGQYEAQAPAASALARAASFVVRTEEDGGAWFAALAGTLVIRGRAGGMVVLRAGETVTAASDGTLGHVAEPGTAALAEDDWVAVNAVLDGDLSDLEAALAEAPVEALASMIPDVDTDPSAEPDEFDPDREHPWRVGVAAGIALALAVASVIIGRAGTPTPDERSEQAGRDPRIAVPGPPAFSTPAFTTPDNTRPLPEARALPPEDLVAPPPPVEPAAATESPIPTPAPVAQPATVTGTSCTRARGGVVVYTGVLRNRATTEGTYHVHVRFVTAKGATVATASTTVADVAPDASKRFRATSPANVGSTATACEVDSVEPV